VQVLSVAWICEIAAVKVCPDGAMPTRRILATGLRATSIYVDRLANSRHCVGSATDRHARTVTGGRQPRLGRQIIVAEDRHIGHDWSVPTGPPLDRATGRCHSKPVNERGGQGRLAQAPGRED
jgi:hypothetical protein